MRPIIVRRPGAAAAALGGRPAGDRAGRLRQFARRAEHRQPCSQPAAAGGPGAGGTTGPGSPAPSACSLLRPADGLAIAATFRGSTITIDGHTQSSQPPLDPGVDTVVILVGQNVFQVVDDVPVDINLYANLDAARQQAATALAAKILSHMQSGA
jgi:hypothetical protein